MTEQTTIAKGVKHVTVACKHPNGILLRLFKLEKGHEPVMGGGIKEIKVPVQVGDTIRINGNRKPRDAGEDTVTQEIAGGYGLTHGVDAEFFAEWMKQNSDHPMVKNNLIFASPSGTDATAQAKEQKDLRSGLEPLIPPAAKAGEKNADPRIPSSIRAGEAKAA